MSETDPAAGSTAGPPEEDPRIAGERHPVARMIAIGVVASLVGIAIVLLIDWFPTPAASSAHKVDTVYDVLLICSVPIFVLVMTVAIYSVVRFRATPGDMGDGAPIHGNTRLEVVWVTIPFLMVTGARDLRLDRARRHRGKAAQRAGRQRHRAAVHLDASSTPARR